MNREEAKNSLRHLKHFYTKERQKEKVTQHTSLSLVKKNYHFYDFIKTKIS